MKTLLITSKNIGHIYVKDSPKVRDTIRVETVDEYREAYLAKKKLPPVVLFEIEKDKYLVADGMHRITAQTNIDPKKMIFMAHVHKGGYAECLKYALGANVQHGLRRSNADKKVSVKAALKEFPGLSNGALAEMVAVSDKFIGDIRKKIPAAPGPRKTIGIDGKTYTVQNQDRSDPFGPDKTKTGEKPNESAHSDFAHAPPAPVVPPPPVVDELGFTVTDKGMPYWTRRGEILDLMKQLSEIKCTVDKAQKSRDKLYTRAGQGLVPDLSMCRSQLKLSLPYAVCPTCNGQLPEKCGLCDGKAVVDEELYNTVPREIRAMREKQVKK